MEETTTETTTAPQGQVTEVKTHGGIQFTIAFERKLTEAQQEKIKHHVTHMVNYLEDYYDQKNKDHEVLPEFKWNAEMDFT